MSRLWPHQHTSPDLLLKKLSALQSWGVSRHQILQHPSLLLLDAEELEERGHVHFCNTTADAASNLDPALLLQLLASRLQCDVADLDRRLTRFPKKWPRALAKFEDLNRKITLLSGAYSLAEIGEHSRVLVVNFTCLSERLAMVTRSGSAGENLWRLADSHERFRRYMATYQYTQKQEADGSAADHLETIRIANALGRLKHCDRLRPKIHLLLDGGFTESDLLERPKLLQASLGGLSERLTLLHQRGVTTADILDRSYVFNYSTEKFQLQLERWFPAKRRRVQTTPYANQACDVTDRLELIARTFNTTRRQAAQSFSNIRLATLSEKLHLLAKVGVTKDDVLRHPYVVRLGVRKLRSLVRVLERNSIQGSLRYVCAACAESTIPQRGKRAICHLVGATRSEMAPLWPELQPALARQERDIKQTMDFLIIHGFTADHVRQCPFILNHSTQTIDRYLLSDCLRDIRNDPIMMLNALCYVIELDSRMSENVADEDRHTSDEVIELDSRVIDEDCRISDDVVGRNYSENYERANLSSSSSAGLLPDVSTLETSDGFELLTFNRPIWDSRGPDSLYDDDLDEELGLGS